MSSNIVPKTNNQGFHEIAHALSSMESACAEVGSDALSGSLRCKAKEESSWDKSYGQQASVC
jgi:hypothetical protein